MHRIERDTLECKKSESRDEEEHDLRAAEMFHLDDLYQRDLQPAMRYSFIVLVHIVFETQLRYFCSRLQQDNKLADLRLKDLRGSPIDQARTFLTKLAGFKVQDLQEWQQLRSLQKVRDCIVHTYGHVTESKDKEELSELASKDDAILINEDRICLTKAYCTNQLIILRNFFEQLFKFAGWQT